MKKSNKMRWMKCTALAVFAWGSHAALAEDARTYPLDVCVISGAKLGSMGEPYRMEYEGREVLLCCASCKPRFERAPKDAISKLNKLIIEKQKADYPLAVCVVSGEPLDAHGGAIDIVHQNRLVRLCCQGCLSDFEKEPETFMKKLDVKEKPAHVAAPAHTKDAHGQQHRH